MGQRGYCGGFQLHSVQEGLLEGSRGDLLLVSHGLQLSANKAPQGLKDKPELYMASPYMQPPSLEDWTPPKIRTPNQTRPPSYV